MQPGEIHEPPCLFPPTPTQLPLAHFGSTTNNIVPTYQFSKFVNNPLFQQTSLSSTSTSDKAEEQQLSVIINERKQRRMISNRESARRSRVRKQRYVDELWSQIVWLRNENSRLTEKLNYVLENRDRVMDENDQLKKVSLELLEMISDMKLNSPFPSLRGLEDDDPCIDLDYN